MRIEEEKKSYQPTRRELISSDDGVNSDTLKPRLLSQREISNIRRISEDQFQALYGSTGEHLPGGLAADMEDGLDSRDVMPGDVLSSSTKAAKAIDQGSKEIISVVNRGYFIVDKK